MVRVKAIIVLMLVFFSVTNSFGQQEVLFSEANDYYNKGDYNKAISLYKKVVTNGKHSADLYFNLANAYYKSQSVGESIYYYEKALSLAPDDIDIQNNYAFAKQNRIDAIEAVPKGFLSELYTRLMGYSVDVWAFLSIVGVFLFVAGFVLFYLSTDPSKRKMSFGAWVFGILLAIVSVSAAFSATRYKKNHVYGVLLSEEIKVQSEPNLRSEQLFKLHEGTKVQVLESIDDWSKVELKDGKTGWISSKAIKKL